MKFRFLILLFAAVIFSINACSMIAPTPTPTPTPAPTETATPVPTATRAPTSRPNTTATQPNPLPPTIAFALNKTQSANSISFDFESAVTTVTDGATKKIPGLALKGIESTLNRQVTISGTTSDTNEFISYDVIVVGEDAFIKGLTGVAGVNPKEWYRLPEALQEGVRRLPSARGLINSFSPEDVGKAQFKAAGSETLDGESCSVWSAQNPQFAQTLIGLGEDSELKKQVGEIDATEFKLYTCADGYIHLMDGSVKGHSAQNKANTAVVTLHFQLNEFNKALTIQPPSQATPFPTRVPEQPTPAPTVAGATPIKTGEPGQPTQAPTDVSTTPTRNADTDTFTDAITYRIIW